jgi:hypothetical protein
MTAPTIRSSISTRDHACWSRPSVCAPSITKGIVFDNLYFSSFGWGGDPENASRLRISKNKWYNFNVTFRRDQNSWDYNLLANPLNPPNLFIQVNNSPHTFETRRRWYDYNLTLLPQSPIRVRLGYSRNVHEGPSFSTIHEGTDTVLFQGWRNTLNAYQVGVDFKLLHRTNISYDQFLQYYKGDTTWTANNQTFQLSTGMPVDAGIIYNPAANSPCANTPTSILDPSTTPATLKPTCNGFLGYSRFSPARTTYPVEQLTLQSSYFRRLDVSARLSYSSSTANVRDFGETFSGLLSRTNQQQFFNTGPARVKRVVASTDFGVTIHLTDSLRLVDTFRFSNVRISGLWNAAALSLFGSTTPADMRNPPVAFNPVACAANPVVCPQHSSSSPADQSSTVFERFLGQDSKYNTIDLEYDFSRRLGGHLGYRYGHRRIPESLLTTTSELFFPTNPNRGDCATQPLNPDGSCSFSGVIDQDTEEILVNEHSGLFGLWARPSDALRLSFDLELLSADNAPTRITPLNLQRYKARGTYKPKDWLNLSGTVNILESRNNVPDVFHREHNRNYGFGLTMIPKERYALEFGYNYNDVFSTTNVCFTVGNTPPPGSTLCGTAPFILAPSIYTSKIHFGYASFMFKPMKRVTTSLGYSLVSTSGNTLIINPTQQTLGPLAFNWHRPNATVSVALVKGLSWNTSWGYYGYNEKSLPGEVGARDFRGNNATVSLKYEF